MSLNRLETGSRNGSSKVVGVCNTHMVAVLRPPFLFAAEIGLNPRNSNQSPHDSPSKREAPSKLHDTILVPD